MPAATSTVKFHPVRSTRGGLKFSGGEDIFAGFQPPFPTKEAKERERKGWAVATASHPLSLSLLFSPRLCSCARHCSGDISVTGVVGRRVGAGVGRGSQLAVTRCLRRQRGTRGV